MRDIDSYCQVVLSQGSVGWSPRQQGMRLPFPRYTVKMGEPNPSLLIKVVKSRILQWTFNLLFSFHE